MTHYRENWDTLDVYKGFSLCILITLHTCVWWMSYGHIGNLSELYNNNTNALVLLLLFILFGWFSISFPFTAGISFWFWLRSECYNKKYLQEYISILQRALIIFSVGYFLSPTSWYIFQFIALSTLIAYLIIKLLKFKGLLFFGLFVAVFSEYLRNKYIQNNLSYTKAIWIGDLSGHYFWPFFPWFSIFVMGIFLGRFRLSGFKNQPDFISKVCILIGLILYNIASYFGSVLPTLELNLFWGKMIFQPSSVQLMCWAGLVLISFGVFDLLINSKFKKILIKFKIIGQNSLIIFILHFYFFARIIFYFKNDSVFRLFLLIIFQILSLYFFVLILNYILKLNQKFISSFES